MIYSSIWKLYLNKNEMAISIFDYLYILYDNKRDEAISYRSIIGRPL